jgi:hypothetical protein
VQLAIPEVASLPSQLIVTGSLYQPFESAERVGAAVATVGAVASILIVLVVTAVVPPSLVAMHVVPGLGPSILTAGSQPLVELIGELGSLTVLWTTT